MAGKRKPKESALQSKVMNYIRSNYKHSRAFKVNSCSVDGVMDVYASIPGFGSLWIEMKRDETEKPRPNQVAMLARIKKAGTPTFVCRSWREWMIIKGEIDERLS